MGFRTAGLTVGWQDWMKAFVRWLNRGASSILIHGRAFANAKEREGVMGEELKKEVLVEGNKVLVKNVNISKGPKDNRLWETVVSYTLDFTGFNLKELLILAARSVIIDLARARNEKGATAHSVRKTLDGKTFVWEDFKPTDRRAHV